LLAEPIERQRQILAGQPGQVVAKGPRFAKYGFQALAEGGAGVEQLAAEDRLRPTVHVPMGVGVDSSVDRRTLVLR